MDFERQRQIMIDSQIRVNGVTSAQVIAAFRAVPREVFVPRAMRNSAYAEHEIVTGHQRALWTARDLGKMLHELEPGTGDVSLVIGAGAGYSAALLGHVNEAVIALEDDVDMVASMSERFATIGADGIVAVQGDLAVGLPDQGPFDIILVNGMIGEVQQTWLDQLGEGGRMGVVVARAPGLGEARIYKRTGANFSCRNAFECCPPTLSGFVRKPGFVFGATIAAEDGAQKT